MKKLVPLLVVMVLAGACSKNNSSGGSADNGPIPEVLDPKVETYVASNPNAESKTKTFLAQVAGKKLVFAGEASRTIENGVVKNESNRSVEECFKQKEITTTDSAGKVTSTKPRDYIISLKFMDAKYAIEETQTSSGKVIRTQYSLTDSGQLQVNLVEASANSIFYKAGGVVVVDDSKLILRLDSKSYRYESGKEFVVIDGLINELDQIFTIP
jgi:hypothetical protein